LPSPTAQKRQARQEAEKAGPDAKAAKIRVLEPWGATPVDRALAGLLRLFRCGGDGDRQGRVLGSDLAKITTVWFRHPRLLCRVALARRRQDRHPMLSFSIRSCLAGDDEPIRPCHSAPMRRHGMRRLALPQPPALSSVLRRDPMERAAGTATKCYHA